MKIKKMFFLGILLVLIIIVCTTCKESVREKKLDPVTLKIMIPWEKNPNYEELKTAVEEKLKDSLNVKLDFIYVPWGDLAKRTEVALASGEDIDLIFDAPWLHMNAMISAGHYTELSDLLEKYGENIVKTRPQAMWDANKFDDKIMGIPLGIFMMQGYSYNVRKDLRLELGLPSIKTYDELIKYAYAVHKKYPDIYALFPNPHNADKQYTWVAWRLLDDNETYIRYTDALPSSLILYYKNNDGKVYNLFDNMEPKIWKMLEETRKLCEDGVIDPDIMTVNDIWEVYRSGKCAVMPTRNFSIEWRSIAELEKEGKSMEAVRFFDLTPGKRMLTFRMDNFICVPSTSKNKERAIQFLNWANEQDNYDMIEHGIKGQDWEPVGDNKWKAIKTDYDRGLAFFALIWNPTCERFNSRDDDEAIKYMEFVRKGENFKKDIVTGFAFNTTPIKDELAQYNAIEAKYYVPLFNGIVDPEEYWPKFKKEAEPLVKKIQIELQKQIDEFLTK